MKPEMILLLVVCVAILVLSAVGIYLTGTERPAAVRKLFVPGFGLIDRRLCHAPVWFSSRSSREAGAIGSS